MDEALSRLSQSVEKELQAKMESLVQQFMVDSVELCRQVCKQHFADFRQAQLRDATDPVVIAVTQGRGPTRDEATRQAARLLVSSAILVSATGDSAAATEPVKAPPAVSVVAPPKVVHPGPKNALPKPMSKQALMPKPKPQDARKSITEQVMGGMTGLLGSKAAAPKAEPKAVIKAPAKAKAPPESSLPVPAGMLSYIRKSFAGPPAQAAPAPGPSSPPKAPQGKAELPKKSAPKMDAKAVAKAPAKPKPPQPAEPIEPTETATSLEDFETF